MNNLSIIGSTLRNKVVEDKVDEVLDNPISFIKEMGLNIKDFIKPSKHHDYYVDWIA
jgi:hypothetical protein